MNMLNVEKGTINCWLKVILGIFRVNKSPDRILRGNNRITRF